jgi:hypothetical protein
MGLPTSSTLLVGVHRSFGFSVQSASPAIGRCTVLACEPLLCSVQLVLFSFYDSAYSTLYGYLNRVYISIHSVIYLT